jgi:hypothetical protein
LTSATRRRSLPRRSPDKGMARGWYQIGWSTDFPPGTVTPIDATTSDVRVSVWVPTERTDGSPMPAAIRDRGIGQQHSQVEADLQVWANQTYIDRPPFLTTEAESMRAFRAWSAQWYQA